MDSPSFSVTGTILKPFSGAEQASQHGHQSIQDPHRETEIITAVRR